MNSVIGQTVATGCRDWTARPRGAVVWAPPTGKASTNSSPRPKPAVAPDWKTGNRLAVGVAFVLVPAGLFGLNPSTMLGGTLESPPC